jgi:tetratricopeptide (TPR) repeat protein
LPVRQILGAVLLKSNQTAEAELAFRKDLSIYPENGWSLFGLYKSLEAQGKTGEASKVKKQFSKAFSKSDVVLTSSIF